MTTGSSGVFVWADDLGYQIRDPDLRYVRLDWSALQAAVAGEAPLGMNQRQYQHFLRRLDLALDKAGAPDADVRLQGSAAHLFSGQHKSFPQDVQDVAEEMMKRGAGNFRTSSTYEECWQQVEDLWLASVGRPNRPFFDVMFYLGMDKHRSDIDVQISSGGLVGLARAYVGEVGLPPEIFDTVSPTYKFLTAVVAAEVAAPLLDFGAEMTGHLNRPVAVKIFDAGGPPTPKKPGRVSSAFDDQRDWIIRQAVPTKVMAGGRA